ncbi:MAG: arginine--tRNA ligase [Actinomycetota bacterium]|nr:arginine--tRNA ligase [Actinomycetota bacterium]
MSSVRDMIAVALSAAMGSLGVEMEPSLFIVERPARIEHGEFSTNVAMVAAKELGEKPRMLAEKICSYLTDNPVRYQSRLEIAGPGFINFFFEYGYLHDELAQVVEQGEESFARSEIGAGERVQLEFCSANPTGPLHVGNGWWASYGDALARLLRRCGYKVSTEYYVNDTGGQIRRLGESLLARRAGREVEEEGYQGDYVKELAERYTGPDDVMIAGKWAAEENLGTIKASLDKLDIHFDVWFSQASIEESGAVQEIVDLLASRGLIVEEDSKKIFLSTRFGDSRDRYLVKAGGDFTYLAGDIAYHYNKFVLRGFQRVIDIFGADHHGQVASLKAAMDALGVGSARLEILLGQMVSLLSGEDRLKFSKRKGNLIPLDDLVDELGPSATRLLSLSTSIDRATSVDIEKVKAESMDNPVYYIQYAHARMASIERVRDLRGIVMPEISEVKLSLLDHPRELALLRELMTLPEVVEDAALERAPYKIANWLKDFSGLFHSFYHDCYVISDAVAIDLTYARLYLVAGCKVAIRVALSLLGVEALEQM